jgi:undecaprenyl-phosphate 4-deoxy-4-formamido-L-arabinose transferase
MASISVIIPVYNSEKGIPRVIESLAEVLPTLTNTFEAILVEDGSPDKSWESVAQLAQMYPWVRGIRMMRNYGQHNALLCGIREARYDIIVTMDDDGQHPAEELPRMLTALTPDVDVIYGSPEQERHGLLRDLASQVTKLVLQSTMGAETARNISAYRVFRAVLREGFIHFHGPYVNLDVLLTWSTKRFKPLLVPHRKREIGQSNYTLRKLITHTFNMVTGFSTLPLQVASLLGFVLTVFGIILLFYILVIRVLIFQYDVPGFTFLASMISIFAGTQLFILGIIGEYLARMHFRLMDKPPYVVRETSQYTAPATEDIL